MKVKVVVLLIFGLIAIVLAGCNQPMGQSDTDLKKQSDAWKAYQAEKDKTNPPPAGDGPSN